MKGATIIPTMRYHDAATAIEWLGKVFGFESRMVVPGDGGSIMHAQLTLGNGMVMLSSARSTEYDEYVKPPGDIGGIGTQSAYIFVEDLNAHYEHTVAAGGDVVLPLKTEDTRSGYSCRDPEGHLWNFGDYNPWA